MSKESLGLLIRKLRKEKGFSYRGLEKEMKKMAIKLVMDESGDGVMGDFRQQEVQGMSDKELDKLYTIGNVFFLLHLLPWIMCPL